MDPKYDAVVDQIRKKVGKSISFKYPGNEGARNGVLKDRAVRYSSASTEIPYWDVVDLIEFSGEPIPEWIRIGYYRKPKDKLVWGSQTTITEPIAVWKELLVQAGREKSWFKKLLEEVMAELQEESE